MLIAIFFCFRMSRKRRIGDLDIICALQDGADSEDGLDFDDDSVVDPDFIPELENFEDEIPEVDIDVGSIIENLEDSQESASSNIETVQANVCIAEPSTSQKNPANKNPPKTKAAKLNLRWKKKNLELNAEQLMFTGSKSLGSDLLDLDTPIQFFFYLFP